MFNDWAGGKVVRGVNWRISGNVNDSRSKAILFWVEEGFTKSGKKLYKLHLLGKDCSSSK